MIVSKGGGFRPQGQKSKGRGGHIDPPMGQDDPKRYGSRKMGSVWSSVAKLLSSSYFYHF